MDQAERISFPTPGVTPDLYGLLSVFSDLEGMSENAQRYHLDILSL